MDIRADKNSIILVNQHGNCAKISRGHCEYNENRSERIKYMKIEVRE